MTFEEWYTQNVPEHHRKTIEKNDWIKVWMREAWEAGLRSVALKPRTDYESGIIDL